MIKHKINLKFKENGKSLNEIITNILKIEIEREINTNCNIVKDKELFNCPHYHQAKDLNK